MDRSGLYSAVWRWHFYAGLLTLPFLVLLAVTGGLYLFKDEINDWRYRELLQVPAAGGPGLPASAIVAAAAAGRDGTVVGYLPPPAAGRSARVIVETGAGESRYVFVDPADGRVLGDLGRGQFGNLPLMALVRRIHSLEVLGWPGNRLIEIVAGWALILAVTGVYLWWPRGRKAGIVSVRRHAGKRTFWRDVHAVTGAFAAALIAFMALTGLPWSGVWGEGLKTVIHRAGLGYPAGFWFPVAKSDVPLATVQAPVSWSFESLPVPASTAGSGSPLDLDTVLGLVRDAGMPVGSMISFPRGPDGVWSASIMPDKVAGLRTLHLDQYTGAVLFDARYADLGAAARGIEWGISVHTGQQYGRANQLLMLLTCIAIVVMSVAAAAMWWSRRPAKSLGAPQRSRDYRAPNGVIAIITITGLLFPLVGVSILTCLLIDAAMPERWRTLLS